MKLIDKTEPGSVIPSHDSTLGAGLESMERMQRAVLYARVSSDTQQKEGTIDSQVVELKRQIAAAGDALVREYIDDGISGTVLDRPALEQLRQDAKANLFNRRPVLRRSETLVTTAFNNCLTRGFASGEEPQVAVCLLPGTEVVFEAEVECFSRSQRIVGGR